MAQLRVLAYKNPNLKINLSRIAEFALGLGVLDIDRNTWRLYSQTKANLELLGKPKGDLDILQACVAKRHNLKVVTNNIQHFKDISSFENWINH